MPPEIAAKVESLWRAIAVTETAIPGRQRQVRVKHLLRCATDLHEAVKGLETRLDRQWSWFDTHANDEKFTAREDEFLRRLAGYVAAHDAASVVLADALRAA